ncbi:hypothetical protein CDH05_19245 [Pseudomonas lactis]|nr:hypothetical protein CDH05_19245 [Pseudomonas lactis]
MTTCQPTPIDLTPRDPIVGAGLPAIAACQPPSIYLAPHDQPVGAGLFDVYFCHQFLRTFDVNNPDYGA